VPLEFVSREGNVIRGAKGGDQPDHLGLDIRGRQRPRRLLLGALGLGYIGEAPTGPMRWCGR
jgi:hypothetical protein